MGIHRFFLCKFLSGSYLADWYKYVGHVAAEDCYIIMADYEQVLKRSVTGEKFPTILYPF